MDTFVDIVWVLEDGTQVSSSDLSSLQSSIQAWTIFHLFSSMGNSYPKARQALLEFATPTSGTTPSPSITSAPVTLGSADSISSSKFNDAVDDLTTGRGQSNTLPYTATALSYVRNTMFTSGNLRTHSSVPSRRVVIVVTQSDPNSHDGGVTAANSNATSLKTNSGASFIYVKVGSNLDPNLFAYPIADQTLAFNSYSDLFLGFALLEALCKTYSPQ